MRKFWNKNKFIIILFLVWRIALFLIGLPGFSWLTFKASFPSIDEMLIASSFPQWIWQWGNFDGVHYLEIAQHGYFGSGLQVFFPIYPLLIKLGSLIFNNYFLSAMLISNISFLIASLVLYKLISQEFDQNTAKWSLLFLYLFPTSFFFGAIYTESIFLLFLLLSYSTKSFLSGIFSFLSGATRLIGSFLTPATILGRPRNWWTALSAFALGSYMLYLFLYFHNPLYFLSGQGAFKNGRATSLSGLITPPQVVFRYLKIFMTASPNHYDFWVAVLELTAFLLGIAILLYLTLKKKVPSAWLIFSWLSLLLPSFSGTLSSMPRYLLTIFPIYIFFAQIKNHLLRVSILAVFALLLGLFTILFTRGYWIS